MGGPGRPAGPGPGRGTGPRGAMGGKPKKIGPTVKRILSYIGKYKILLLVVFLFMITNTVTSLIGGYMTRPIINRLTEYVGAQVNPDTVSDPIYKAMDGFIMSMKDSVKGVVSPLIGGMNETATDVMFYVGAALVILAVIYAVSVSCQYLQARIMMTVSQSAVEKIRNDLFEKL